MTKIYWTSFLLLGIVICLPTSSCLAHAPSLPLISVGGGIFNATRVHHRSTLFQFEYRTRYRFFEMFAPIGGFFITSKASTYVYGGFGFDLQIGKRISIFPSIVMGLYAKGYGKDLKFPLEFKSTIECAYIFENQSRIGLQISHISNASISDPNPGAESLSIVYVFPLN